MEKVWNISTSILAIMAVLVLIGQVVTGSEIGILAFILILYVIIKNKYGENAHNG